MINIIERPVLTEKTLYLATNNMYTFAVSITASKMQIAKAIEDMYGVHVTDVRTARVFGKTHRVGRKMNMVKKPDWKKAMVQLKSGETIDAFQIKTSDEQVKK